MLRDQSSSRLLNNQDSLLQKVISDEKKACLKRDSATKTQSSLNTIAPKVSKQSSQNKATGKKDKVKVVSASLNSSFHSQVRSEKGASYDLLTPLRK